MLISAPSGHRRYTHILHGNYILSYAKISGCSLHFFERKKKLSTVTDSVSMDKVKVGEETIWALPCVRWTEMLWFQVCWAVVCLFSGCTPGTLHICTVCSRWGRTEDLGDEEDYLLHLLERSTAKHRWCLVKTKAFWGAMICIPEETRSQGLAASFYFFFWPYPVRAVHHIWCGRQ